MTERLRELFVDMLSDEPPLRTTTAETTAAGRRLRRQRRTLWTVVTTILAVAVIGAVPGLATSSRPTATAVPASTRPAMMTPTPVATVRTTATTQPGLRLSPSPYCPSTPDRLFANDTNASVLPDPGRAVAAIRVAARSVAPGLQFILRYSELILTSAKAPGIPQVAIIFDVGDDNGFGSINFQIRSDVGPAPEYRAEENLSHLNDCVTVQRHTFTDGAVALYYPYGPPAQELETTHVWYYAAGGFTMNIGTFPGGWSSNDNPDQSPPPPPLPVRSSQPLTVAQTMQLADAAAHAAG